MYGKEGTTIGRIKKKTKIDVTYLTLKNILSILKMNSLK